MYSAAKIEKNKILQQVISSHLIEMTEPQEKEKPLSSLPFPPVTPQHILDCSFHSWYPKFRSVTPKARLIPLSQPFLDYLRADGIILPPEHQQSSANGDPDDSGYDEDTTTGDDDPDPSESWPDVHSQIAATIRELGGKVVPKLNWSSPKDATWIATTNDMECRTANDIYLLLKSSDFITHDLEHAFDGCAIADDRDGGQSAEETTPPPPSVPYHLVLRKSFNLNPALEFRCFVRKRKVIAISQREMNYFDFLFDLRTQFLELICDFVEDKLSPQPRPSAAATATATTGFPAENFVVDVYIPPPHDRVWLIDINPWAPRTDPLLFSWLELLTMDVPDDDDNGVDEVVRIPIYTSTTTPPSATQQHKEEPPSNDHDLSDSDSDAESIFTPEFRLVQRDDPEAYQFSATKYSAHKLPKDVVDASLAPGGMRDMMEEWKKVMDRQQEGEETDDD